MKTIHDFIYSPGKLTPAVVWYSVKVGRSHRDRVAHGVLLAISRSTVDCLYVKHSKQMADFQEKVAESFVMQGYSSTSMPLHRLRRVCVDVQELAKIVKKMPLAYLNRPMADIGKNVAPIR